MINESEKTAAELFGDGSSPQSTRDRLIESATNLYYECGIHAVGLDRILNDVGVTKTTFYNHFESRDELAVEVIRRRDKWERETWFREIEERADGDPNEMLMILFDVLDEWFNGDDYAGCLFINAAFEFPNPHDPVHQAATAHKQAYREEIRRVAKRAGVSDPEQLADYWMVLMEGALTLRQTVQDHNAAKTAKRVAQTLLDREL